MRPWFSIAFLTKPPPILPTSLAAEAKLSPTARMVLPYSEAIDSKVPLRSLGTLAIAALVAAATKVASAPGFKLIPDFFAISIFIYCNPGILIPPVKPEAAPPNI